MHKDKQTKATIRDLIAKKMQKEADRFKTIDIYVPSMDRTLTFKKPADDTLLDVIDEMGDGGSMRLVMGGIMEFQNIMSL